jgi:hypothetical protein
MFDRVDARGDELTGFGSFIPCIRERDSRATKAHSVADAISAAKADRSIVKPSDAARVPAGIDHRGLIDRKGFAGLERSSRP